MTDLPSPLSVELQRAHDLLAALVTAGSTLAENRATYDRWSEQFPIPDGTSITPSATDDALEVRAPGVDPAGPTHLHLHLGREHDRPRRSRRVPVQGGADRDGGQLPRRP
jgi:hypothetical protein